VDREEILSNKREYYKKNKDKINRQNREWKQRNRKEYLAYMKEYNAENAKRIAEFGRGYRRKNKEKIALREKKYYAKNKDRVNAHRRKRYRENPLYKLNRKISSEILKSLRGQKAGRRWETLVGYSLQELKLHLEKQFVKGMSWENHGTYWHIDHITPISWYKFSSPDDYQFKLCWSLSNLQPLLIPDNLKKHNFLVLESPCDVVQLPKSESQILRPIA